jgi:hypothetical protein
MSNDRLQRIAQGTQHGDKDAAPAKEMEGGKTRAIELGIRVLVKREMLRQDGKAKPHLDWSRTEDGTTEVEERTIEYHGPVHLKSIPTGGFVHCHWYGALPNTRSKWDCAVCPLNKIQMSQIKGV